MPADTTDTQSILRQAFGVEGVIENHRAPAGLLVSVIIPSYNCLAFLPRAIRSIQVQHLAEMEILILDDASTDGTWHYLQLASACDQRIKPVKLAGVGVARARNEGLKLASGQYIAFLDADDRWLEQKLLRQLVFHYQQPEATLSFSNYLHVNENNGNLGDCFGYWPSFGKWLDGPQTSDYRLLSEQATATIFAENVIGTSTVMLNREALGEDVFFDESLKSAEDWDFWLQASLRGPIGFTTSIDMAYLMRSGSETSHCKLRLQYMQTIILRYLKPVLRHSPLALLRSVSRLLTGYAEYYRTERHLSWSTSLKPCVCHFFAFLLSPSLRLFKALLADFKTFLLSA